MINLVQVKPDPCSFTGQDSALKVSIIAMAYVDDLPRHLRRQRDSSQLFSGDSEGAQPQAHWLLHSRSFNEFLGRIIKKKGSGQITMEFSQQFIDYLLGLFDITGKVASNGVKIQPVAREEQVVCDSKLCSKYRAAVGQLLWTPQLRDHIKYPVKELSRSLSDPLDVDFQNLIHHLMRVNHTRDFVSSWNLSFLHWILRD